MLIFQFLIFQTLSFMPNFEVLQHKTQDVKEIAHCIRNSSSKFTFSPINLQKKKKEKITFQMGMNFYVIFSFSFLYPCYYL